MKISDMKPGDEAVIQGYESGQGDYKRKLLAMGLTTGARVRVLKVAPLGDPVEIGVRGYKLSLRKEEARVLNLEAGI